MCPSDTWSCARCDEDPAPQHRATGPARLARDELLRRFVADDSCTAFLQTLPPYASEHGSPDSLHDMDTWVEKRLDIVVAERMNSKARLDTLPYPLAVLCEAAAQANGMPFEFLVDTIVAANHSLLNKDFYAHLGQYESKSRYWFVGTAEPGVGKSPAMEPVMKIIFDVLREHAALLPGHAEDDWHDMQSSTIAAAVDKLRRCELYLCLFTGEAGRCLDLAYAAGGKSDAGKTVDLSFFLGAAHGGEFSHQTLLDRQRTMKEKVPHPEGALPRAERLCLNTTNVHVMWLQQELYLPKYWCVLGKQRPIGLVQRCLFSFGAQHHRYDASLSGFFHTVCAPIVKTPFHRSSKTRSRSHSVVWKDIYKSMEILNPTLSFLASRLPWRKQRNAFRKLLPRLQTSTLRDSMCRL